MHDLVEGQAVDKDQVVARAAATHREIGEVAGRYEARQSIQRAHDVAAGTDGAAKLLAVEKGRADSAVQVRPHRSRDNDNLLRAARNNPRLKTVDARGVNVYDVVDRDLVVLTRAAVGTLVEVLSK